MNLLLIHYQRRGGMFLDKLTKTIIWGWLSIELVLYIGILFLHIPIQSGVFHFLSIVFCFGFVLIKKPSREGIIWIRIAFLFTVAADFFLTLLSQNQILGTGLFACAQLAYAIFLYDAENKNAWPFLAIRLFIISASLLLGYFVLRENLDLLAIISLFYFSNLLINMIHALFQIKRNPLFFIGLCLFICCDILVGLSNGENYLHYTRDSIWGFFVYFPFNLTWMFYLPSQVLIALSSVSIKKMKIA